ncbi:alpha/beta hydrolase [Chloroflexota bacterium]
MKQIDGYFKGQEGFNLYFQGWLPPENPWAIIFLVHGLAEHSGRYAGTAAFLQKQGYAVFCLNHQGHGLSEGRKGYIGCFATYTADLSSFIVEMSAKYPDIPVFLLGHSMRGTIAIDYCLKNHDKIEGLILSAPALQTGKGIKKWQLLLTKILATIAPKAGVDRLDSSAISKDQAVVAAYRNDELVYTGKLSARLCLGMLKTMHALPRETVTIRLPVLIMHGSEDRLISSAGSLKIHKTIGSEDKTLKIYQGLYHEILNEPEKDMVYEDMLEWIGRILADRKDA